MESGLAGKTVLVTGGAGGIGSAICRQMLTEGARVAVHYLSSQREADTLVKEVAPGRAISVKCDVTIEDEVDKLFSNVEHEFGPIDVLVANAGIWVAEPTPIHEMTLAQWNQTITTNLTSVFLFARRFLQAVRRNKLVAPSIVLIGSTAGIFGEANHADYAASKSGLTGLLLSMKNELVRLAPRGRVNAVCPSWIRTDMADSFCEDEDAMKRALQTVALRKIGVPNDVASMVVFLASELLSGHISGQALVVAGGMEGRMLFDPSEIELS